MVSRRKVIEDILSELNGRSGFDDWWYSINGDIRDEITETLIDLLPPELNITSFLDSLKRKHYINEEDCWYSCPISGECCDDRLEEYNCGADDFNKKIEDKITQWKNL